MTGDSFTIFPALDLRRGNVVRLAQGDPARQTIYSQSPLHWAEKWKSLGAKWLHVVNLDGAFGQDALRNLQALQTLTPLGLKIEFGGGVRSQDFIDRLMQMGVERVCLGTAAIQDPDLVEWALAKYGPEHISIDIGVRDGKVMVKGWQEATPLTVTDIGQRFRDQGLKWCVLTDIRRDGTRTGIGLALAADLQAITTLKIVASGGVHSLEEVRSAREKGLAGIIIGRALYEGNLSLQECFEIV